MGIFKRVKDVFKSNINDLISKAENPEKSRTYGGFSLPEARPFPYTKKERGRLQSAGSEDSE